MINDSSYGKPNYIELGGLKAFPNTLWFLLVYLDKYLY